MVDPLLVCFITCMWWISQISSLVKHLLATWWPSLYRGACLIHTHTHTHTGGIAWTRVCCTVCARALAVWPTTAEMSFMGINQFARFIRTVCTRRIWWSCEGLYVCYTTNTLDTIEAFIAETYVQLVATKAMCYSTSWSYCSHWQTDDWPRTVLCGALYSCLVRR